MKKLISLPTILAISGIFLGHHVDVGAMKTFCPMPRLRLPSRQILVASLSPTALHLSDNNRWWDGPTFLGKSTTDGEKSGSSSYEEQYKQYQQNGTSEKQNQSPSLITREMEDEVMASARASMDSNVVSRAMSSLIDSDTEITPNRGGNVQSFNEFDNKKSKNSLRDLALSTKDDAGIQSSSSSNNNNSKIKSSSDNTNTWDTQQIAIASGATTFFLSPLVIPIIHSFLPPIIPFPSSISFTGAALLGTLSYIVALGDPTDQSLGDGMEVGGAVSRIVGRTALQSVQTSAPRLKAAARAMVDYDSTTATLEELQRVQRQLSQTVLELGTENDTLRKEVALWQAVEDVSSMYKLEELKEIARYEGIKGYSTEGKNALLRRLVREGILNLDLSPYY